MDYRTKKAAYNTMQGVEYFEADQALLKVKQPQNRFSSIEGKSDKAREKYQREILWLLLNFCTIAEIEANRKELMIETHVLTEEEQNIEIVKNGIAFIQKVNTTLPLPDSSDETMGVYKNTLGTIVLLPDENKEEYTTQLAVSMAKFATMYSGKLVAVIEKTDTASQVESFIEEHSRLIAVVPTEGHEIMLALLNAKNPIPLKIEELKTFDLTNDKCDNNKVNELFKFFGLTAPDNKKASKIAALQAYLKTLPIEVEGTEGETTGVGEGVKIESPETDELEDVKQQLEEKEEENEDLKNENQELQDKVEELNETLDEEKKNTESPS